MKLQSNAPMKRPYLVARNTLLRMAEIPDSESEVTNSLLAEEIISTILLRCDANALMTSEPEVLAVDVTSGFALVQIAG